MAVLRYVGLLANLGFLSLSLAVLARVHQGSWKPRAAAAEAAAGLGPAWARPAALAQAEARVALYGRLAKIAGTVGALLLLPLLGLLAAVAVVHIHDRLTA